MELRFDQKQALQLVMTTELRQAIEMLQYSSVELREFLQKEELNNPLMELRNDVAWEKSFEAPLYYDHSRSSGSDDWSHPIESFQKEDSMYTHLLRQVSDLSLPENEQLILKFLIENINDLGYLTIGLQEVEEHFQVSHELVVKAFSHFKTFRPIGIGARTINECLLWQLENVHERSSLAEKMVKSDYDLELLGNKKWKLLADKYNVSLQDIQFAADLIQSLEPKPGSVFGDTKSVYLLPDITIKKANNDYEIIIHESTLPVVHVNETYRSLLTEGKENDVTRYLHRHYRRIMWIIRSLEERRVTLFKLTEAIIKKQREFLEKGSPYLKPLTLKEIAREIDMHESTVSRAITNKMIETPIGLFDMKALFPSRVPSSREGDISSQAVKELLAKLIAEEDKQKPLSDQQLADRLKAEEGISISRRTVAKYREQLNIPASLKRRRY